MNRLDCPVRLDISAGPLDPASTIFSDETYVTVAGVTATFELSWFDEFGNQVDDNPSTVQVP